MRSAYGNQGFSGGQEDGSFVLPDGFRFGVATSGFQIEGGFNGPGEPSNNWVRWERSGKIEPSGIAVDFWRRPDQLLDRAAAIGCDAFRLGIEWARVEPRDGEIDTGALDHYAEILAGCLERGLKPLVTLHHFTHPSWLGEDFWLSADSPQRFADWTRTAVSRLAPLCDLWVTLNEVNLLRSASYFGTLFPPGRGSDFGEAASAADHLYSAHVLAYDAIHEIQPDASVTTNNASATIYEFDRFFIDVLLARSMGVDRDDLPIWLGSRKAIWYQSLARPNPLERGIRLLGSRLARPYDPTKSNSIGTPGPTSSATGRFGSRGSPKPIYPPPGLVDAVWKSSFDRTLDAVGIDYYDPVAANHIRVPGHKSAPGRSWAPSAALWDDIVDPDGLVDFCKANSPGGAQVWIVENGICNRVRKGRSFPRADGWDRVRYLEHNLRAVVDAIKAGVDVGAYYHWSLVDNYEWGSYQPRFGLHAVDRERGARILDSDSMGADSAGTYKRLIEILRSGKVPELSGTEGRPLPPGAAAI